MDILLCYEIFMVSFRTPFRFITLHLPTPASDPTNDSKDTAKTLLCSRLSWNYKPKDTNKWSDRSFVFHPFYITNHLFSNCTKKRKNRFAFCFQIKSGFQRLKDLEISLLFRKFSMDHLISRKK